MQATVHGRHVARKYVRWAGLVEIWIKSFYLLRLWDECFLCCQCSPDWMRMRVSSHPEGLQASPKVISLRIPRQLVHYFPHHSSPIIIGLPVLYPSLFPPAQRHHGPYRGPSPTPTPTSIRQHGDGSAFSKPSALPHTCTSK